MSLSLTPAPVPDIADVTNFVHPETPLDLEAADRGTSVYLVERRIDMLPKPLTEGTPSRPSVFSLPLYLPVARSS